MFTYVKPQLVSVIMSTSVLVGVTAPASADWYWSFNAFAEVRAYLIDDDDYTPVQAYLLYPPGDSLFTSAPNGTFGQADVVGGDLPMVLAHAVSTAPGYAGVSWYRDDVSGSFTVSEDTTIRIKWDFSADIQGRTDRDSYVSLWNDAGFYELQENLNTMPIGNLTFDLIAWRQYTFSGRVNAVDGMGLSRIDVEVPVPTTSLLLGFSTLIAIRRRR